MTNNGLSRWVAPQKTKDEKGSIVYAPPEPLMCECGYERPIGGDGFRSASFFYEDFEWFCPGCGKILEPRVNEKEIGD